MDVLLLAPHPFYQDRGSPLAVNLLLRVLSDRGENVDVLVYHEGTDIEIPNVSLTRTTNLGFIRGVPPGFSWKKIVCDIMMCFSIARLVSGKRYDLIYAVEESVFMALIVKWVWKIPYAYDMDSRLSEQLDNQYRLFKWITRTMRYFERVAIRNARAVAPVCDNLIAADEQDLPPKIVQLRDIALLGSEDRMPSSVDIRSQLGPRANLLLMYVGNLLPYQGIDLLLDGFALVAPQRPDSHLVIIGGTQSSVCHYRTVANTLDIGSRVTFLGARPFSELESYLVQADVLVSPRIQGSNTPMKLYSYLQSGTASLLTDLPTHTQVAGAEIAMLVNPSAQGMSEGMLRLIDDPTLREELAANAKRYVQCHHSYAAFRDAANELFDWLDDDLNGDRPSS